MHTQQNNTTLDFTTTQELGDNLLSVGNLDQAQKYYEKAAIVDADQATPYVGMGTIAIQRNDLEEAQLAFRVACRLDPKCSRAYEGLAKIAHKNQNYNTAFQMYLKCLELDPDNLAALLGLFQTSSQMGSFAKIIHYLEIYLNMHPADSSVMFSLATLYMKEDQFEKAKLMLLKILALFPDNRDAENLLEEVQQNIVHTIQS